MQLPDGWSSKVRIEAQGSKPTSMEIRHFMTTHLILDGNWQTLHHNEVVNASFNYIIDGKITFLHLSGRVKLNRIHGITLEFDPTSVLRQLSRRLVKARRYDHPCHFLVSQRLSSAVL